MALKDLTENVDAYLRLLPAVGHSPKGRLWVSYDEEGMCCTSPFKSQAGQPTAR